MLILLGATDLLKSVNLCLSPILERFKVLFLQISLRWLLNSRNLLLKVLEAGKSKVVAQAELVCDEGPLSHS